MKNFLFFENNSHEKKNTFLKNIYIELNENGKSLHSDLPEEIKEQTDKFFDHCRLTKTEYDFDSLYSNLVELTSQVMTEETGINFEYFEAQEDCIGNDCIMMTQNMPWAFNKTEIKQTKKSIDEILNKYKKELGLDNETPEEQEIEYFG